MRPPGFWQQEGLLAAMLSPASWLVAAATARRVARPRWRAPVPVLCCGNVSVGGAGKTTLALDLAARLVARGVTVHVLSRGYGRRGGSGAVLRVHPEMDAAEAGDEPLLLARVAPTWVAADRAAAARSAVAAGAQALLLDDGLQNPGLVHDVALLVIDGAAGFGNARVLPAGPLREGVAAGAARAHAAVLIGPDARGALAALPAGLPVLRAWLEPDGAARALAGQLVLPLAGIARPAKFHATLREAGARLAATADFPDHHPYTRGEVERVLARAGRLGAVVVTTPKDAVRLPPDLRARLTVAGVRLAWEDPAAPEGLLDLAGLGGA